MNDAWIIYTTMRRRYPDGTEFTIRPTTPDEPRLLTALSGYQLTITHTSGLKAHSHHATINDAQTHADELMDSFGRAAS